MNFWKIDDISQNTKYLNEEKSNCEDIFTQTTFWNTEGCSVVRIALNNKLSQIGNSRGNRAQKILKHR